MLTNNLRYNCSRLVSLFSLAKARSHVSTSVCMMMLPPEIRHLSQSNYSPPCLGSSSTATNQITQLGKNICTFTNKLVDRKMGKRNCMKDDIDNLKLQEMSLLLLCVSTGHSRRCICCMNARCLTLHLLRSFNRIFKLYPIENCITKHYFTYVRSGCETCLLSTQCANISSCNLCMHVL